MNDPNLRAAAREMIAAEPKLGEMFSLAQLTEHVRTLAKRLKLAGELNSQTDD